MDNLNMVNRSVVEEMTSLIARECRIINTHYQQHSCSHCPYYDVCHSLNRLENALADNSENSEYNVGGSI